MFTKKSENQETNLFKILFISLLIFSVLLLAPGGAMAQTDPYPNWENFVDGGDINDIETEQSTMWVASTAGLMEYDRNTGQKTYYRNGNSGLAATYVYDVEIDVQGNKWLGTYRGLFKYDGNSFTQMDTASSAIPGNAVTCVAIDSAGNIWTGFQREGMAKYDGNSWTSFDTVNSGIPGYWVNGITFDSKNNLWVTTYNNGFAMYDNSTWQVYTDTNPNVPCMDINDMVSDTSGNVWIASFPARPANCQNEGIIKANENGLTLFESGLPVSDPNYLPINLGISSLYVDDSNRVWAVGEGHIMKYDGSWFDYHDRGYGIKFLDEIETVFVDDTFGVWIETYGTSSIGCEDVKLHSFSGEPSPLNCHPNTYTGLRGNFIQSLEAGMGDTIWAGPNSGGLYKYNGSKFASYPKFEDVEVRDILAANDGNIWLCTDDGLLRTDGSSGSKTTFDADNTPLLDDGVRDLAQGHGGIWIASFTGISRYDSTGWTTYSATATSGLSQEVSAIAVEDSANLWIGHESDGIAHFNNGNWTTYTTANSGLPSNEISHIQIDTAGNKWVATPDGLVKYDGSNWKHFTSANSGMPGVRVRDVTVDAENNIWIAASSRYGLVKYDGSSWSRYHVSNSGISDDWLTNVELSGGDVYMGSIFGGISVFRNQYSLSAPSPELKADGLKVYPNPAKDLLHVDVTDVMAQPLHYELINTTGKLVKSGEIAAREERSISVKSVKAGVYMLRIKDKSQTSIQKVIIH